MTLRLSFVLFAGMILLTSSGNGVTAWMNTNTNTNTIVYPYRKAVISAATYSTARSYRSSTISCLWQSVSGDNDSDGDAKPTGDDENDKDDDSEENSIFYDDFADFGSIGGSSSSSSSSEVSGSSGKRKSAAASTATVLQERIRQVQSQETKQDYQRLQNWRSGNWQVRGFSLDPDQATDDEMDENVPRIHASKIVPDKSFGSSATESGGAGGCIWVGRTNGEMVRVQLGSDYWTHFSSKLTATMQDNNANHIEAADTETKNNDDDDDDDDDKKDDDSASGSINIKVSSKLVRQDERSLMAASDESADETPASSPFEILNQFPAHDAPVAVILSTESYLFTAAVNSGSIQQWLVTEDEDSDNDSSTPTSSTSNTKIVPLQLLADAHSDTVVCLKAVSMTAAQDDDEDEDDDDASVLFSASQDGSLALWDIKGGDLLYKCQMTSPDTDLPVTIQCADVDGTHVFVGTSTGQVWAYNVVDWITSAAAQGAVSGTCPPTAGRWTASESSITSLSCAGPGSLGRGNNSPSSSLLLTGAADGVVKQWEVLSRPGSSSSTGSSGSGSGSGSEMPSTRLEQWPKLPTQRLPKKAHLFRGHDMDVTALLPVDATKFLSASKDGTVRAWNPATGKELFRMDGFTEALRSLCLQEDLLVTDGMKQFVCVHDFDVGDADEGGYELDYEED